MEEDSRQKIRKVVTVLLWVLIVAWACNFFYNEELKIGRALPMFMAAQSMDVNQLSYVYEGDVDEIFGQNINKEELERDIAVYMYENTKTDDWGRIIIYDRATTSFKYVIKTKNGSRVSGEAVYDSKLNEYVNTNTSSGDTSEGCKINLKIKNPDKILYNIKDVPNDENLKCIDYNNSFDKDNFFMGVIHKLI